MSLFNIFSGQLSSVIEWKDKDTNLLWYKHPAKRDEIINASKLIVAPGQGCVLVYEGEIKDVLNEPGMYNLKTDNHPFITTLGNLRQNFDSEHKLYIFFYRNAAVLNQFWGTQAPIKYLEPEYKLPVELGVNGSLAYRISDPTFFYVNVTGNQDAMSKEALQDVIVNKILEAIRALFAMQQPPYLQIDATLAGFSQNFRGDLQADFDTMGLTLLDFKILGSQFDPETHKRIGSIADITSQNRAAQEAGLSYTELEKLRALRDAAKNEGGLAGIGAQLGAGMELSKIFGSAKEQAVFSSGDQGDFTQKLQKLNLLLQESIITQAEFDQLKKQILSNI